MPLNTKKKSTNLNLLTKIIFILDIMYENNNNKNNSIDEYSLESPTECYKLRILGLICIILFISSLTFNSLLLNVFIKNKHLRTPNYASVIALTILNLIGTLTQLPFIIISNLSCKWIFNKWGCNTSSLIMFWIGSSSIYLMTSISFQRFYVIYNPFNPKNNSFKMNIIIIIICLFIGFIWSIFPVGVGVPPFLHGLTKHGLNS